MYLYIEEKTLIKFYKTKKDYLAQIDTGHFFHTSPAQMPNFFRHTLMSRIKNQRFGATGNLEKH